MNELTLRTFEQAILATHGCGSVLLKRVEVGEVFGTAREGEVLVFDLLDHPTAKLCYAWSVGTEVTAVLHEGPVDSPGAAVRASIVEGFHSQN